MAEAMSRAPSGPLREHLQDTTTGISDWISNIFRLARRLDAYAADDLIHRDRSRVDSELRSLEARLQQEDDPATREDLQEALRGKALQRENLERLQNTMERAQVQLEATLTALGTVYSQLLLAGARDVDSSRSRRVVENIREQVASLNDLLAAMSEVYGRET